MYETLCLTPLISPRGGQFVHADLSKAESFFPYLMLIDADATSYRYVLTIYRMIGNSSSIFVTTLFSV